MRMLRTQFCDTMKTGRDSGALPLSARTRSVKMYKQNIVEQRRRAVGAWPGREDNSVVLVIAMMARQYRRELEAEL